MMSRRETLTAKQSAFVREYLIDFNATRAAIRAGYSLRSAGEIGRQLLGKTGVSAAIERSTAERSRRTGLCADRVLQELGRIAFANIGDVVNLDTARFRPDISEADTACISAVRNRKYLRGEKVVTEQEVHLCDKLRALELLGRHLGMFTKRHTEEMPVVFLMGEERIE